MTLGQALAATQTGNGQLYLKAVDVHGAIHTLVMFDNDNKIITASWTWNGGNRREDSVIMTMMNRYGS